MDKNKNLRVIKNAVIVAPMVAGAIITFSGLYKLSQSEVPSMSTSLKASTVNMSGFEREVSQKSNELYAKLRSGEITSKEFSNEYDKLIAEEAIENWARNSQDEAIKGIVATYDEEVDERVKVGKQAVISVGVGMGTMCAGTIAGMCIDEYLRKKRNRVAKEEIEAMDSGETSVMGIDV